VGRVAVTGEIDRDDFVLRSQSRGDRCPRTAGGVNRGGTPARIRRR
jgi:hypothetical protein